MDQGWVAFFWVVDTVLAVLALVMLYRDTRFADGLRSALWALVILIIPFLGPLLYLVLRPGRLAQYPS